MVLAYIFFKPYIAKIYNDFPFYIYIYIYNLIGFKFFDFYTQ